MQRYYNAGEKPVIDILVPHPELIHRVEGRFNSEPDTALKIYDKEDYNWRRLDATHLLIRWRCNTHHFVISLVLKSIV
jgi:hypothetical protein